MSKSYGSEFNNLDKEEAKKFPLEEIDLGTFIEQEYNGGVKRSVIEEKLDKYLSGAVSLMGSTGKSKSEETKEYAKKTETKDFLRAHVLHKQIEGGFGLTHYYMREGGLSDFVIQEKQDMLKEAEEQYSNKEKLHYAVKNSMLPKIVAAPIVNALAPKTEEGVKSAKEYAAIKYMQLALKQFKKEFEAARKEKIAIRTQAEKQKEIAAKKQEKQDKKRQAVSLIPSSVLAKKNGAGR